tara:strand:- start:98 stop:370 length:273 start_codon:yes stop_codon:yes gene_type:complete
MVVAGDQVSTDPKLVATQTEIAQLNENIQHTLDYNKPSSDDGNQGGGYRKRRRRKSRKSKYGKRSRGKRSRGKRSRGKRSRNMRKSRRRR